MSSLSVNSSLIKDSAYINGLWCQAESGRTIKVFNPATGDLLGQVPDMARQKP